MGLECCHFRTPFKPFKIEQRSLLKSLFGVSNFTENFFILKLGFEISGKGGEREAVVGGECRICLEEVDFEWRLECSHRFCRECLERHVGNSVMEGKRAVHCPSSNCLSVLDELCVIEFLKEEKMRKIFSERLVDSFVSQNPFSKFCPNPKCGRAVLLKKVSGFQNDEISCSCGVHFCFYCQKQSHVKKRKKIPSLWIKNFYFGKKKAPLSCKQNEDWESKNKGGDEALNVQFAKTFARDCPKV